MTHLKQFGSRLLYAFACIVILSIFASGVLHAQTASGVPNDLKIKSLHLNCGSTVLTAGNECLNANLKSTNVTSFTTHVDSGKMFIEAASFPSLSLFDLSQSSGSRSWVFRSNATELWIAPTDDTLGSFPTKVLVAARSGSNVTNVNVAAGTASGNQLTLSGNKVSISASGGDLSLSAGGDANIIVSGSVALVGGAASTAYVFGDTVLIDDHNNSHAATVKINNKLVCLADGTNCPASSAPLIAYGTMHDTGAACTIDSSFASSSGAGCSRTAAGQYVFQYSAMTNPPNCTANVVGSAVVDISVVSIGAGTTTTANIDVSNGVVNVARDVHVVCVGN